MHMLACTPTNAVTSTEAPMHYSCIVSHDQHWKILRTSNLQESVPCPTGEGVGTQSPTWILTYYARLAFSFPVYTRLLGSHLNSWIHI